MYLYGFNDYFSGTACGFGGLFCGFIYLHLVGYICVDSIECKTRKHENIRLGQFPMDQPE